MGGQLGIEATLEDPDECTALFAESLGRIVLEVREENAVRVLETLGKDAAIVGKVVTDYALRIKTASGMKKWSGNDLENAWRGNAR